MSWGDSLMTGVVAGAVLFVVQVLLSVWSRRTERKPGRDERIRVTALGLAIESHGPAVGDESDACYPARAKVFERYLRTGDHKAGGGR